MQERTNPPSVRTAVTLVELTIVVLILGIMAAVAMPRFADALSRFRADAAATRVKADLQLARRRAKMQSADQVVDFDASANLYTLSGVSDLDRPGQTYQVQLNRWPYEATIVSVSLGGDETLVFNGFGLPDTGGQIVVQAGSYQLSVLVDAASGNVSIQ